jgi:hypothetical protein
VLADEEGHFELQGLPAGRFTVNARKPGFFSEQEIAQGDPTQLHELRVEVGPDAPPTVIKLYPAAVITGRITANSEPLEEVPVKVMQLKVTSGNRYWEPHGQVNTSDDGGFRIADLMPGTYYVVAGPGNLAAFSGSGKSNLPESGYPEMFFPGVTDLHAATPLDLTAGQQARADFEMTAQPIYRVSGLVSGFTPDHGFELQFINSLGDRPGFPFEFAPDTGVFHARVPAGPYTLRGKAFLEDKVHQGEVTLTVNSDVSGVRLDLSPSPAMPVDVRMQRTHAARDTSDNVPPLTLHLRSAGLPLETADIYADQDYAAHKLTLNNIEPGTYSAEINVNPPWYVQSATCGDLDLFTQDLKIGSVASMPPISITLRDDGAELNVQVSTQGATGPVSVLIVPVNQPRMAKMQFAENGSALFRWLAPGDYQVLALTNAANLEYSDPDVLAPYLSQATRVTLAANDSKNLSVQISGASK